MAYKIAIANEKGGVAKTTTALSLGGALIEQGKRVLLVDLDPQANLTLGLGYKPKEITQSIAQVMLNSANIATVIKNTSIDNLDLVPSNPELGMAERFLPVRQNHDMILNTALSSQLSYDYIIFDCPPALGALTLNALTAANMLLVPTQAEYFSAYALKNMMTAIRQVREQNNANLIYRVLITMFDKRNRTHRTLMEQLRNTFGDFGLLNTVIEVDTKLRESPIMGVPIMNYVSSSRSSEQYRALAEELNQDVEKIQEKTIKQSA